QVSRGRLDRIDNSLGLFMDAHRLEDLFFLYLSRSFKMRLAKILFAGGRRFGGFARQALGGQAGGDIFGALNFGGVAAIVDPVTDGLAADGFGAGLGGLAVRPLGMAQAATGAEA